MVKIGKFWKNSSDFLIRPQSGIFSAALIIALTYSVSMILGIFRERILVSRFFPCCRAELDSYYAAFRIPDIIFQLIVIGALSSAFIPVFSDRLEKDQKEAYSLASSLINIFLLFFLILCVIIYFFAKPFSQLIAGGFSDSQINLMTGMTRIMLLAQIFFLVSSFFSAIVQTQRRFLLPSLSPIVYNLGIIFSILLLSNRLGIWSAVFGVVLGAFLHLLIQIPLLLKLGYKYNFVFDFKNYGVRKVIRLMIPRTLALAASQFETTYSVFLATSLVSGSLTIYNLAQRLVDLPVRLLGTSVGQAALPTLSNSLAQGKKEEFKRIFSQSLNQILYLAFPVTALFLVLRVQAVRFAYGAKSFPWVATLTTGRTLAVIVLSIFSQSAVQLLVRGFYAFHDTLIPFLISVISVLLNVSLSIYFVRGLDLGIFGLALSFSISNFVNFLLLLIFFQFGKEKFLAKTDVFGWMKMIIASLFSASAAWILLRVLDKYVFDTTRTIPLLCLTIVCSGVGIGIYLLFSLIFKIEEMRSVLMLGRKIGGWHKTLFKVEEVIEPRSGSISSS